MTIEIPPSLRDESDNAVLVDGIYYLVRALRNLGRGYRETTISTEAATGARELAEQAVREIELHQGSSVANLDPKTITAYTESLEDLLRRTYVDSVGLDTTRAANILKEMRAIRE